MFRKQSIIPDLVFYVDYYDCTIYDAFLNELRIAENNTISLPHIGRIRVNKNKITGSYGKAKETLCKMGYKITNKCYHNPITHITESEYTLHNPNFNHSENERYQGHEMHS